MAPHEKRHRRRVSNGCLLRAIRWTACQSSGAIWRSRVWLRLSGPKGVPYDSPALPPLVYSESSAFACHSSDVF